MSLAFLVFGLDWAIEGGLKRVHLQFRAVADCVNGLYTGRADELAGVRRLTVWKWRIVVGHGFDRTDSGHEVADLTGHVGLGFGRLTCWFLLGCEAEFRGGPHRCAHLRR